MQYVKRNTNPSSIIKQTYNFESKGCHYDGNTKVNQSDAYQNTIGNHSSANFDWYMSSQFTRFCAKSAENISIYLR